MELCPEFLESMVQMRSSDSEQESPRSVSSEQQELRGMAGRKMSFLDEYSERVAARSLRGSSLAAIPTMMEMVNEISAMKTKVTELKAANSTLGSAATKAKSTVAAQTHGIDSLVRFSDRLITVCERQGRHNIQDEYMSVLLNLFRYQDLEAGLIEARREVESLPSPRTASWHLVVEEQRGQHQEAQQEISSLKLRLKCVVDESICYAEEAKSLNEKNTSLEQEVEKLKAALKSKDHLNREEKCVESSSLELYAPHTPSVSSLSECSFDTSTTSSSDSPNKQLAHALRRAEVAEQCAAKYRKELFSTTRIENLQDMLLPVAPPRHVSSLKFCSTRTRY
eukprot:TRINITY_DN300_c0_g3_i1.p1 TRINITY_DN300_c0_g3~~TRINITY_DN300_c0_g3_i1.p1  ORF type:complete len:338 (+),score=74.31 TRINITY_DN300_c0_g3_i1:54-1067(+)